MPSDHDTEAVSSKVFMTVSAFPPSPCRLAAHVRMSFRHDDIVVLRPRTAGILLQRRSSCESSQRESYGQNHRAADTSNHFLPCSHRQVTSFKYYFYLIPPLLAVSFRQVLPARRQRGQRREVWFPLGSSHRWFLVRNWGNPSSG